MSMNSEINIVWVSNIIFEPYLGLNISASFRDIGIKASLTYLPYEQYSGDSDMIKAADFICVCLNFDELYPNALNDIASKKLSLEDLETDLFERCSILYGKIKDDSCAPVIWFGFEDYYNDLVCIHGATFILDGMIDKTNHDLLSLLDKDKYIDTKRLIAEIGIENSYNYKGKYRWSAPYSKPLVERMANEVYKQHLIHTGYTKKCIVLDCDNVLWGGILSEDGIEQIQIGHSGLGRSFQDFQRFLLSLYYRGVILAICSKNDEEDVLTVFRKHSGMLLKEEHIACFSVNWNNKPDNIIKIAEDLNIGLDSIAFIDDSEIEVQAVKKVLPEVTALLYKPNAIRRELSFFNVKNEIDLSNITNRMQTYKTNNNRNALRDRCSSYEDYLKELCVFVDIHSSSPDEYARIVELTQRTNKCTNGRRYTIDNLKLKLQESDFLLFTVSASDRFSDLGIIGAIGIQQNCLDLFALSCRALGRNIENVMISFVKENGVKEYWFESTGKNDSLLSIMEL